MKAIILAGGSGTRLWPLSRGAYPKQFLTLGEEESFLQKTIRRVLQLVKPSDIVIITNERYQFHVEAQAKAMSPDIKHIILEPWARNTAPAIALAVAYVKDKLKAKKSEVLFVSPADHLISPNNTFKHYLKQAMHIAYKGYVVTLGIQPSFPETGYGYIKKGKKLDEGTVVKQKGTVYTVEKFVEKPDVQTARMYVASRKYFWNSGMFVFTVETIEKELLKYSPGIYTKMANSFDDCIACFKTMPNISIDYAVMEKSHNVALLPMNIFWSDIGSWESVYEMLSCDSHCNVKLGDISDIDTKNSIIVGGKRLITTIGLENMLVVDTDDALLVAARKDAQRVKTLVQALKEKKRKEVDEHRTSYRPWGKYTVLEEGLRYKVKTIVLNPGEKLSLQLHHKRSEHWVVVKGIAKVTINRKVSFIHENESIYVPRSTPHRLENSTKFPLEIIEVQMGSYVGEDDIVRLDDKYGRVSVR